VGPEHRIVSMRFVRTADDADHLPLLAYARRLDVPVTTVVSSLSWLETSELRNGEVVYSYRFVRNGVIVNLNGDGVPFVYSMADGGSFLPELAPRRHRSRRR